MGNLMYGDDVCLLYHISWQVLSPLLLNMFMQKSLVDILMNLSDEHGYNLETVNVNQDTVDLVLGAKAILAPYDIVRTLKSSSSLLLIRQFDELRKYYHNNGRLWQPFCRIYTVSGERKDSDE